MNPDPAEALRLQILGPLRMWRDGVELDPGPRQQRCLLALLLVRAGRPISTSDLIDLIWGQDPPASAVNVIHKYVGALRRLMQPQVPARDNGSYLLRHGQGYRFVAGPDVLDLVAFRTQVRAAEASLAADRREEALQHYREALALGHGPAGDTLAPDTAVASIFATVDNEFLDTCETAADLAVKLGRPAPVLAPLRLAASMAPLHEPVQASLIRLLAAAGQQADALALFQVVRDRLADDLGVDPGPGLQEAQRQVLAQTSAATADPQRDPVRPAQLPPDLTTFVGRSEELSVLDTLLRRWPDDNRTSPLIVALDGMGGVGKSTLAVHFAHRIAAQMADGQLYLNLRGHGADDLRVSPGEALRSLLSSLGASGSGIPESMDARTGTYRSLTAGKRILVMLDNVGDVAQVRPLLPNSAQSVVLVTSRTPLAGLAAFEGAHLLHVDLPDMTVARDLLRRRLEQSQHRSDVETGSSADILEEIITLCGRLPLALAILAARLNARPNLSTATVADELRDGAEKLTAFAGTSGVCDPRTAFTWSYRQLSPGAAALFRMISVAFTPGVSAEACASLSAEPLPVVRGLLQELTDAALLEEDDQRRFSSHVLVKAFAQELFQSSDPAVERDVAVSRLLQHYLHSSYRAALALAPRRAPVEPPPPLAGVHPEQPGSYDEAMQWFENHIEVLAKAVRFAAETGLGIVPWQLAVNLQAFLQWNGRFHDWRDVMQLSLRAARERGDRIGTARALRSLAGARHSFGDNNQAIELLLQAQSIFTSEGMLLEQGIVHGNLHRVYSELGRHEEALAENERALTLYRAMGNEAAEVWGLEALGRSLVQLGQFAQGQRALEAALVLNQKLGRRTDECEIRMYLAQALMQVNSPREAVVQLDLGIQAAHETRHKVDHLQALLALIEAYLAIPDIPGSAAAWRRARDVMHSLPNGGTLGMRDALHDLAVKVGEAGQDATVPEGTEKPGVPVPKPRTSIYRSR